MTVEEFQEEKVRAAQFERDMIVMVAAIMSNSNITDSFNAVNVGETEEFFTRCVTTLASNLVMATYKKVKDEC